MNLDICDFTVRFSTFEFLFFWLMMGFYIVLQDIGRMTVMLHTTSGSF